MYILVPIRDVVASGFASLAWENQAHYLFLYVNQSAIEKCLE
jgi:hypothetical protein